jgi:hypothetical protein
MNLANFLIQTIDKQVKHDFSFGLIEAIEYQNWLNKGTHSYCLAENMFESDFSSYVPSGTIQFVKRFIATYHDVHTISPINVPNSLMNIEYLKRNCEILERSKIEFNVNKKFVKSNEILKGFTGVVSSLKEVPETSSKYLVSDVVEIDSEWRTFIFDNKIIGLQNYSGDFTTFPDVDFIKRCVAKYSDSPPAYTLDIGINKELGSFVIEAHNFYSCGLYGFNDCKILPQMFIRSFYHLLKNKY